MTGARPQADPALAATPSSPSVSPLPGFDPSRRPPAMNMGQIMLAGEVDAGRRAIWPHLKRLPKWFVPGDWQVWPVLSYGDGELHIVAVASARPGSLRRLIDGALAAGLRPVVVEPLGQMVAIMQRWGWVKTIKNSGWEDREEWRPCALSSYPSPSPERNDQ